MFFFPLFISFCNVTFSVLYRLVGGAGDIKLTKDGNTLLKEMVSPLKKLFFFVPETLDFNYIELVIFFNYVMF